MVQVILVEDEEFLRMGLRLATPWKEYGCEVIGEASNIIEAERIILELKPSLVITDIRMPQGSGLELIERLQGKICCEFIIISGFDEFEYAKKAIHLGVKGYLLKPIDDKELEETVKNAVKSVYQRDSHVPLDENGADASFPSDSLQMTLQNAKDKYLQQALAIIKEHYSENLTLKSVAEQLEISESYLGKLFKTRISYTFLEMLTLYRIKEAIRLLEDDNPKIYEIAYSLGYKDVQYFSMVFKKIVGVKPSDIKNGYRLSKSHILKQL